MSVTGYVVPVVISSVVADLSTILMAIVIIGLPLVPVVVVARGTKTGPHKRSLIFSVIVAYIPEYVFRRH